MNFFFSFIGKFIFLLFLVVAHFFLSYFLPYPFSTINIVFASLILFMILSQSGTIVWMAFFTHFCIELYSVTPFGIILFSSTMSLLFTFWLFQYVLSNTSWYSAIFLTFFALLFYRSISLFLLFFIHSIGRGVAIPWSNIVRLSGYELIFTEIIVIFGYILILKFRKNFKKHNQRFL